MRQTRFHLTQNKKNLSGIRMTSIVSKILLYSGVVIVMFAVIYMLVNMDKADSFLAIWTASMIAGVGFMLLSLLPTLFKRNS